MNQALQIGDIQISCAQVLAQLQDSPLLPQLLREIAIEESIDLIAAEVQLDLTPTPAELELLSPQVAGIVTFQGMNAAQIAAITTRTIKLQKFKQAGWGDRVSDYYQIVQSQRHRVTYSILLVADGLLAQELFFRIQSGEQSFAELAIEYSQHETAAKGGLIGPIPIKDVPPEIAQVLYQLTPGGLSPLFQLHGFYGLIRLNQLVSPQLDEQMFQVLLDELFDNWIQTQLPKTPELALAPSVNIAIDPTANIQVIPPDFTIKSESHSIDQ
jgi:parvulin-like peptidyl-prolyl isomerase